MDNTHTQMSQRLVRSVVAIAAAGLLVGGAAWHGFAAESVPAQRTTAAQPAPTISHAIAAGHDSYADVVKVVAPAVVTIRTEGKARVAPTQFGEDDDDLLRRFFGDQFGGRGQQGP